MEFLEPKPPPRLAGRYDHGYLPHLRAQGRSYFVTFRLEGTLPQEVLRQFQAEREALLAKAAVAPVGKPALRSADFPVGEDEWLMNGGGWAKPYDQVDALPAPQVLRMRLAGANAPPAATGDKELRGKVNYFIGLCTSFP